MKCGICNRYTSDKDRTCPFCGGDLPVSELRMRQAESFKWTVISILLIIGSISVGVLLGVVNNRSRQGYRELSKYETCEDASAAIEIEDSEQLEDVAIEMFVGDWSAARRKAERIRTPTLKESLLEEIDSAKRIERKLRSRLIAP